VRTSQVLHAGLNGPCNRPGAARRRSTVVGYVKRVEIGLDTVGLRTCRQVATHRHPELCDIKTRPKQYDRNQERACYAANCDANAARCPKTRLAHIVAQAQCGPVREEEGDSGWAESKKASETSVVRPPVISAAETNRT